MAALHVIAKQEGLYPKGVVRGDAANEYVSYCWTYLGADPDQLVGGWLYFHENSRSPSKMGGVVIRAFQADREVPDLPGTHRRGTAYVFLLLPEGRGVAWRGDGNVRHGHGGFVDADLAHELAEEAA